jgi:hypothetical protein
MYLVNPLPLGTYIAFFESGLLITSEELADDLDIPANPITAENKNIAKNLNFFMINSSLK